MGKQTHIYMFLVKPLLAILATLLFLLTSCAPTIPPVAPPSRVPLQSDALVEHINSSTVALVQQTTTGWRPYCTGIWIDNTTIITAAHCIEPDDYLVEGSKSLLNNKVYYLVQKDVMGVALEPSGTHLSTVVGHDHFHDLAMLQVVGNNYPAHEAVNMDATTPSMGSGAHMVGHVTGMYYSYSHGYVAAYRASMPVDFAGETQGPFIQVSMPLWHGNSGGGCFNDYGELIGIADFVALLVPDVGFLIPTDTVKWFIYQVQHPETAKKIVAHPPSFALPAKNSNHSQSTY